MSHETREEKREAEREREESTGVVKSNDIKYLTGDSRGLRFRDHTRIQYVPSGFASRYRSVVLYDNFVLVSRDTFLIAPPKSLATLSDIEE